MYLGEQSDTGTFSLEIPGSLFRKLPVETKALGFDTRKKFDDIAADAEKFKDSDHIVEKLNVAMGNFIAVMRRTDLSKQLNRTRINNNI